MQNMPFYDRKYRKGINISCIKYWKKRNGICLDPGLKTQNDTIEMS
jgi:hypothetical protein